jgi:hypothetical protein
LKLAPWQPQSQIAILALTPDAVSTWLPIKKSKHGILISLYPWIEPRKSIAIQELNSD